MSDGLPCPMKACVHCQASHRFESKSERELEEQDTTFESLSLQEKVTRLKKALEANEEAHSGQFNVYIIKFFKPV
jgi:hypothetical protein